VQNSDFTRRQENIEITIFAGHTIVQVVSHWFVPVEARVHSQVTSYGIYGEQSDTGMCFTLECFGFPFELFLQFSVLIYDEGRGLQ
jgi:hypothetical protein